MFIRPIPKTFPFGFSRLELSLVLAVLSILIVFAGLILATIGKFRTKSRFNTCVTNLKELGTALSLYSVENGKKLPYAGLRDNKNVQISWDDLLGRNLEGGIGAGQIDLPVATERLKFLQCPSDKLDEINPIFAKQNAQRRSYAIPSHNMSKSNWPPNSQNHCGIGLVWDISESSVYPDSIRRWNASEPENQLVAPTAQASVNLSMVPAPASTIAITERVHTNNVIGNIMASTIDNATEHIHHRSSIDPKTYHSGKITYLFVDGHVELLNPLDTLGSHNGSPSIQSGMWTINPND